jgi:uncharacterized protein (TIGR00251 family)
MLLHLKIKPNQRFDKVEAVDGEWIVKVKAPAIDGKANEHLIEFLSDVFKLSKSKIRLKKGSTSRIKCLEIEADERFILECLSRAAGNLHNSM